MWKRIFAVFRARNLEFVRDRGSMAWNIILPVTLMLGLSFAFGNDRAQFTVGVLSADDLPEVANHPFLDTRYVEFVPIKDQQEGERKISRHQLDLLIDFGRGPDSLLDNCGLLLGAKQWSKTY